MGYWGKNVILLSETWCTDAGEGLWIRSIMRHKKIIQDIQKILVDLVSRKNGIQLSVISYMHAYEGFWTSTTIRHIKLIQGVQKMKYIFLEKRDSSERELLWAPQRRFVNHQKIGLFTLFDSSNVVLSSNNRKHHEHL